VTQAAGEARPAVRLPAVIPITIAGAWAVAIAAQAAGKASLVHHDAVAHDLTIGHVLLFLLAWQVMVAAMMMPSTFPLIRLFATTSARQERREAVMASFLGGYVLMKSDTVALGIAAVVGGVLLMGILQTFAVPLVRGDAR